MSTLNYVTFKLTHDFSLVKTGSFLPFSPILGLCPQQGTLESAVGPLSFSDFSYKKNKYNNELLLIKQQTNSARF